MANWPHYRAGRLPTPVPLPDKYIEVHLRKPYGKGGYKLRCNIIKISNQTTLVEAYSRLVRVDIGDGISWVNLNVEP